MQQMYKLKAEMKIELRNSKFICCEKRNSREF